MNFQLHCDETHSHVFRRKLTPCIKRVDVRAGLGANARLPGLFLTCESGDGKAIVD